MDILVTSLLPLLFLFPFLSDFDFVMSRKKKNRTKREQASKKEIKKKIDEIRREETRSMR